MRSLMKLIEGLLWCCGLVMVGIFVGQLGLQEFERMNAVAAYRDQLAAPAPPVEVMPDGQRAEMTGRSGDDVPAIVRTPEAVGQVGMVGYEAPVPDQSLWSSGRIAAFAASLTQQTSPVLGVFEIPRFELELPIYDGASDLHMDRGIARIEGTAMPGHDEGNLGIAGHRDGYFRVLKDIEFGDEMTVTTPQGTQTYVVEQLMTVDPSAVEVLYPTSKPSITLVTCYPFYFVGHAPERFIVRAVLQDEAQPTERREK
jgi:sortase A